MTRRLVALAAALAALCGPASAIEFRADNQILRVPVRTFLDMRFVEVMRQTRDLSCGAAALGTLFKYHYGLDVTEEAIIQTGFDVGDAEKIRRDGFSMLELKKIADQRGFVTGGFKVPDVSNLVELKVPAIALVSVRGYNHFVVIRGVRDGRVYIADPAFGNRSSTLADFAKTWNNVILVAVHPDLKPVTSFSLAGAPPAPVATTFSIMQSQLVPLIPSANRF